MNSAKEFYEQFGQKLLADYASGNSRMESAISFVTAKLTRHNSAQILDLGCGIGWSCHEIMRALPAASVRGVDLSGSLIKLAQLLFADARISYETADVTETQWRSSHDRRYDACVLIDVFEHIPKSYRTSFIESIEKLLAPRSVVMLTCPSVFHQRYLRTHNPGELQPVDEDVSLQDLLFFADAVGGEVTHFEYKSIWRANDYFHAAIHRGHEGDYSEPVRPVRPRTLERKPDRVRRMHKLAGVIGDSELQVLTKLAARSVWQRVAPTAMKFKPRPLR